MRELQHPLTKAVYGIDEDTGLIRVQDDGCEGLYTYFGRYRDGDIFDVDPEFCLWVGGPQVEEKYSKPFKSL